MPDPIIQRIDSTAFITAAKNGATFVDGLIDYGGPQYLKIVDGAWAFDPADGALFRSARALQLLASGTLITAKGEYQWCVDTARGWFQVKTDDDGVVSLLPP